MNLQGRNLSVTLQGEDVALLQRELRQLGFVIAQTEIQAKNFRQTTQQAVRTFQERQGLPVTGVVDERTAVAINAAVDALQPQPQPASPTQPQPSPQPQPPRFVVKGQVRQADGRPLAQGRVRAFDVDLRYEEPLGEATTGPDGNYEISYTAQQFRRAEKKSADLVVRVFSPEGSLLYTSPIKFNAQPVEIVDIFLGEQREPSEFERLIEELTPLLVTVRIEGIAQPTVMDKLADLKEEDVAFLTGETGGNPQHIAFLALAHTRAKETRLPAEAFYGFFRQNLPNDLPALLALSTEVMRHALESSIQQNIIPAKPKNELENILRDLQALEVEQPLFLVKPEVLFSNLTDLSNLETKQADFVTARLNEHLRREILNTIGAVSEAMTGTLQATAARIDFQKFKGYELSTVINESILAKVKKDKNLAEEAAKVEARLAELPSAKVSDLLHLEVPLRDNSIFETDLRRVKTLEYARLAQLDNQTAKKLVQKNLPLDDADEDTLRELVKEGIINDQQRMSLQLTIDCGKLTGDNVSFISAIRAKGLRSVADSISWEKADWQRLITDARLSLPPGETAETHAENILLNIERTYPSQFLLSRLLSSKETARLDLLDSLNKLLANNERLIDGENSAALNWEGVSAQQREKLQKELQDLTALVNMYRHLGVGELVNSKTLHLNQKKSAIAARLQLLGKFHQDNPGLDLRLANFFDTRDGALNWNGIPAADRPPIRKQAMAYQRVLSLADDTADRQMLLSKGYDSAAAIATKSEGEFIRTSGLPRGKAHMTYSRAQESALSVSHNYLTIHDVVRGQFKDVGVSNQAPKLINDLREIDGFDDLFGPQDYCDCEECRSILSPAAYFVDLMYFIEQHVSTPVFIKTNKTKHPLYLKNRRGDLWKLQVTCENTHTLIPYLTIVNEILENYLQTVISGNIYEKLANSSEKISFGLPFSLPLEEMRLYLSHFGITLHDIYRILKQPETKAWRTKINLSKEEFDVIAIPDTAGVKFRFGNPASLADFPVDDYESKKLGINRRGFIKFAGITRQQLSELLELRFNSDLTDIKVDKKSQPDELMYFPEILKNLTNNRLDFIHRFIRLWKKTSWSIPDLDLVLTALKGGGLIGSDVNANAVLYIAQITDIQEKLKLTVDELCSLVDQLPVSREFPKPPAKQTDRRLYERLFDLKKLFGEKDPETHELKESGNFHHYSLNTVNPNDQEIDPKTPILLGGLGVSETELLLLFDLLKDKMPFDAKGDTKLDRGRISLLYRHARLAKALKLNIEDFIQALHLNFTPANLVVTTLAQIHQLLEFRKWLRASPFTVSELRFILKGEESTTVKYKMNLETVAAVVQEVQKSQEMNKLAVLKASLAKVVNLTSNQLDDTLKWVSSGINSAGIQTALNATFTNGVPDHPADLNALLDLLRQMERVLSVFSNLKFKEETVAYLTQKPAALGIADLKNLTLDSLKALTFYKKLITLGEQAEPLAQALLDSYLVANSFSPEDVGRLADLWQQDKSLVESLVKSLTLPAIPIQAVEYLWECLVVCQTLGVNGYSLQKLADDTNFPKLSAARDVALGAFSSKYEDEKVRQDKLEPYQDKINVIKRDALCDYVIARQKDLKFKDLHDIYAFFLLDVEMSGCFRTSRVVCANSSLQLYVHRCLMNLEQSDPALNPDIPDIKVDPALIPVDEWEWRKNYRVWEANRKVFLYPENYIEPDLRDNKTPIFKELEDELLQEKITKEAAETAYKKYVSQFAELARLRIAGSYYHDGSNTYYFFGRTQQDPPQYHYRKWIDQKVWTPWEKVELGVNADYVSSAIYLGKLYLFWVDIQEKEKTVIMKGESKPEEFHYDISLKYSYLNENGKWLSSQSLLLLAGPQTVATYNYEITPKNLSPDEWKLFIDGRTFRKSYPHVVENSGLHVSHYFVTKRIHSPSALDTIESKRKLNLFLNRLDQASYHIGSYRDFKLYRNNPKAALAAYNGPSGNPDEYNVDYQLVTDNIDDLSLVTNEFDIERFQPDIAIVHSTFGNDYVVRLGEQQYLIRRVQPIYQEWQSYRITTSLADDLGNQLYSYGLETFLSRQTFTEHPVGIHFTNSSKLLGPYDDPNHIDFKGAYGEYYRELFFHIPFLIANHCNANQKFKEAKWWYERIFDPTASESPEDTKENDRLWRYIEFRDVTIQKMKDILTNEAAIEQYKKDPFNPHAIARLRLNAYPKAIVMKYIDNLLDWGDYLFALDTMESINEATMLYVLAADILGKRPAKLGKCETAKDKDLTYDKIGPAIEKGSEFLIALENWSHSNFVLTEASKYHVAMAANSGSAVADIMASSINAASLAKAQPRYRLAPYTEAVKARTRYVETARMWEVAKPARQYSKKSPAYDTVAQSTLVTPEETLVFCIPPNYDLLRYWDRVEDRLFKIRHCMNISGVRRQLALFQPPIEPMALVRARAAGLSLEDILGMLAAPLPPYRFSYLIEKAKQFTQTVQGFGGALLSALEKKDVEELTLLRSVHERNILRMTKEIKIQQVREAQYQYQALVEAKANVANRIAHYEELINNGLTSWEITQQVTQHTATIHLLGENVLRTLAGIFYLIPEAGSPFAMKYGGKQAGDSTSAIAGMVDSTARLLQAISASASLEATFQRREEEWDQQLLLAQRELLQVEQQRLASEARQLITEKDLEVHEKTMEQADELHEFYKNKFTSLGLYNHLSVSLNRLYREAYNVAYDLCKMCERTYRFERDDDTIFVAGDNWQFDRAGLLAGERLLLQLQRLEKAYLEQNRRDYEVTQSFSLAFLNPWALAILRQTGNCDFEIPEIVFDLFYPGQYKRLIKSVRVTIPCVAGPYTNISTKLTLKASKVRKASTTDPTDLIEVPSQKLTSIATSNAQNDGGLFELNFRDERYLPFEGAGAISQWRLELPSKIRMFDYNTISDVIIHISYTAKDDGVFKIAVENQIVDTLKDFAATVGLFRLFSLKHEFPNAFHKLLNPSGAVQTTEFDVTKQHFPYFLADEEKLISGVTVYLKPKGKDPVDTSGLTFSVNGTNVSGGWSTPTKPNLKEGSFLLSGDPIKKWAINAGTDGLDKEKLDDILILIKYAIS